MNDSGLLREKAGHYRRLAASILRMDDPTRQKILELACDLEAQAFALEGQSGASGNSPS